MSVSGTTIADLAVLGVVQRNSVQPDHIRAAVKGMFPDQWLPTAGVVNAAVERAVSAGHLSIRQLESLGTTIETTDSGRAQFQALDERTPRLRTPRSDSLAEVRGRRRGCRRVRPRAPPAGGGPPALHPGGGPHGQDGPLRAARVSGQ